MDLNYKYQVSVIIVNYNTLEITENCIKSIREHTEGIRYEIILVDNASQDGSKEYFENDKELKYIYSDKNLGFGKANNLGIERATGKYLFLLNSDTLLLNNAIKCFYDYAESYKDEKVVLGAWLLDKFGNYTHSGSNFPSITNELRKALEPYYVHLPFIKNIVRYNKNAGKISMIDYVTGADLFLTKQIINDVGAFDPKFFMYYDESDWQYRMSLKNIDRILITSPKIVHLEGKSYNYNRGKSLYRELCSADSMFLYCRKYNKPINYLIFRILYFILKFFPVLFGRFSFKEKNIYYHKLLSRGIL